MTNFKILSFVMKLKGITYQINLSLKIIRFSDGKEVAIAYFRAGYTPTDFPSEDVSIVLSPFFITHTLIVKSSNCCRI